MFHKDPDTAFRQAIHSGLLSNKPGADSYAGNFMYMGSDFDPLGGFPRDHFKNIETRKYVANLITGYVTITSAA